jgi:hypothetical protein
MFGRTQRLGFTHFVLRCLLIVGYIGLYEILFRSSHLRYETPQHQPIPLWMEKADEVDASQMGYCYDGGRGLHSFPIPLNLR